MYRNGKWALAIATAAAIAAAAAIGVGAAPQDRRIEIVAQANASLDPEAFWVDPGELVTVTFTNADLFGTHNIVFELDAGRVVQIDPIGFARSEDLAFVAPAALGGYPYYSSVGNDRARGFEGVLYVGDEPTPTPPVSPTGGGSPTRTPTLTRTPTVSATETPGVTLPTAVIEDLHSPNGLAVLGDGTVLIAEGGTGDPEAGAEAPGNGDGRVQRIGLDDPTQRETIADGLTNVVWSDGTVVGPAHAIWWDRPSGATGTARVSLIAVGGGPGHARPAEAAKVLEVGAGGGTVLADTLAHESAENPDGGALKSDPRRLVSATRAPGVATIFVVDMGANAILAMDPDSGDLTTFAVFAPVGPSGDVQAMPSSLALHPDDPGIAFVTLWGEGLAGLGQVRRLEDLDGDGDALDSQENTLWVEGLAAPADLAFAPAGPMAGRLFAVERAASRAVMIDGEGMAPIEVVSSLRGCSAMAFEATGDLLVAVADPMGGAGPSATTDRILRVSRDDLAPSLPPSPTPGTATQTAPTPTATSGTPGTPPSPVTPPATATQEGPVGPSIFLPYARTG